MAQRPPITSLDDFTESINMLVYGDSGSGKTVLAGTGGAKALIVSTEPGTISAKRMGSKSKTTRVKTWDDFTALLDWLRTDPENNARGFEWVIIDTLTELQDIMQKGVILEGHAQKPRRTLEHPELQDYMIFSSRFKATIHALNDLPCNVLYTCHAVATEDEDGNQIVMPALSGKNGTNDSMMMSKWVCGTVHAYGYLKVFTDKETGKDERRWIFKRSGPYFGKDRYGILTPYVRNPNLRAIARKITQDQTQNTEQEN